MTQKTVETQTAFRGVPVRGDNLVQVVEKGRRLSREKAKTVRPRACCFCDFVRIAFGEKVDECYGMGARMGEQHIRTMAVKQTNLMIMKPQTVKKTPPPLPKAL